MDVDELVEAFLDASRALMAVTVRSIAASPVEVTLPQWRVLVLVATRGEQTVGQLAGELGVNSSNATRVCDRVEQLGLVQRRRSNADRRVVLIALTDAGDRVVSEVLAHRRDEIREVLLRVPELDRARAAHALRAFAAASDDPLDQAANG